MTTYPKLIPLAEQLEQTAQQTGTSTEALAQIKQGLMPLLCRLLIYGAPNEAETAWLATYLGQGDPSVWTAQSEEMMLDLPSNQAVEVVFWESFSTKHAPCLYLVAFLTASAKVFLEDAESHILMAAAGVPILSLIQGDPSVYLSKNGSDTLVKDVIGFKVLPMSEDLSLEKDLQFLFADKRTKDDMVAFTGLSAIKKTEEIISTTQLKKQEHFTALRLQRQQDLAFAQKKTGSTAAWQTKRETVNNHKEQFERRLNKSFDEDLMPPQGTLYVQVDKIIESLDYLDEQKKAKGKALIIPEAFKDTVKSKFQTILTEYCLDFAKESRISTHFIEREVNEYFENNNLGTAHLRAEAPSEGDIKRLISRVMVTERTFEYMIPAKKITEYMMGARMYYMVLMMGASMLGLSSAISKNRMYLLPGIILLLGYGIYKMIDTKTKEDEEKMLEQLNNAKESMRTETKRQLDNFKRNWEKMMDEHYKEPVQSYLRDTERQVNDSNSSSKSPLGDDKTRLQFALNSVLAQERTASDWQRNQTSFNGNFQRIRTELTNNIKLYLLKWN
jgi:hypothetical protein